MTCPPPTPASMAGAQIPDDGRALAGASQQRWILFGDARTGLPEIPRVELWAHHRGPIGLLAIPRRRLLIAPHLTPWLLHTVAQAVGAVTARSAWEHTGSPGPLVPAHARPAASVLAYADVDQAYDVGRQKAHALGIDVDGARHSAACHERALAYARGVLDELSETPFSWPDLATTAVGDPTLPRRLRGTAS